MVMWWTFCAIAAANVVNFIDGIDGLIGVTALVYGGFAAWSVRPGGAVGSGLAFAGLRRASSSGTGARRGSSSGMSGRARSASSSSSSGSCSCERRGAHHHDLLPLWPIVLDASATLVRRWRTANGSLSRIGLTCTSVWRTEAGDMRGSAVVRHRCPRGCGVLDHAGRNPRTSVAAVYLIATLVVGVALERRLRNSTEGSPCAEPSP